MTLILWVDAQILKFFTKIAKDFNWLTGKDNFFLARLSVAVSSTFYVIYGFPLGFWLFVAFILLAILNFIVYFDITRRREACLLVEQIQGIKFRSRQVGNLIFRIVVFCASLPNIYSGLANTNKHNNLFAAGALLFLFCWNVFTNIDQPPFKKSQAWQKVKNWFSPGLTQPQAEPIPVRSN